MKTIRRLFPASRLGIALTALCAALSLRCGSDEALSDRPLGGGAGAAEEPQGGAPGEPPAGSELCEPFATRVCVGPGACPGGQACAKDGSGWSACDCGDGGPSVGGAGAGGAPGGGTGEGGGASGAGNSKECQPAPQRGCSAKEKCALVADTQRQTLAFACVADGTKGEGVECKSRGDGTDDCAKGLFCNAIGTVPVCQPFCAVANEASCDTACTELNVGHAGAAVPSGYGVCQPSCSMLEQDCAGGDACVFVESEFPLCAAPGSGAPGAECANYADCEVGSACVLVNAEQTSYVCTPFCEATQPGACEVEGETCLAFPMVYGAVPEHLLTVGLCYPCANLPDVSCELLAAGACETDDDCAPLLEMMGFAYTCSLPAGQCVMLEP